MICALNYPSVEAVVVVVVVVAGNGEADAVVVAVAVDNSEEIVVLEDTVDFDRKDFLSADFGEVCWYFPPHYMVQVWCPVLYEETQMVLLHC